MAIRAGKLLAILLVVVAVIQVFAIRDAWGWSWCPEWCLVETQEDDCALTCATLYPGDPNVCWYDATAYIWAQVIRIPYYPDYEHGYWKEMVILDCNGYASGECEYFPCPEEYDATYYDYRWTYP